MRLVAICSGLVALALAVAACGTEMLDATPGGPADATTDGPGADAMGQPDAAAPDAPSTPDASSDAASAMDAVGVLGAPVTLSDPANGSFTPAVATHDGECLVAWHEFADGGTHIAYTIVAAGTPGTAHVVSDPFAGAKQPSAAATPTGYVVAYEASDGIRTVVRAVEIDRAGAVVVGPDTLTAPGTGGTYPHVATAGAQEVFAWNAGATHFIALRGPGETLAATSVGKALTSQTLLNFPRVGIDAKGTVSIAWRDDTAGGTDYDVFLTVRPKGGPFGPTVNVSNTPVVSDDVALAVEADGTLDVVWVEQDPVMPTEFEVTYATRSPQGALSTPKRFGAQHTSTWMPSVVPGLISAWNGGGGAVGPLYLASAVQAPAPIAALEKGNQLSLGLEPGGALDIAWADDKSPKRIRFARKP